MNADTPSSTPISDPREENLTALLLGELSTDEAARLQLELSRDPSLQNRFTQLKKTLELLDEARFTPSTKSTPAPPTPDASLKLAPHRRAALLDSLKIIRPRELNPAPHRAASHRREWLTLAAMFATLLLATSTFLPSLARSKSRGQHARFDARFALKSESAPPPPNSSARAESLAAATDKFFDNSPPPPVPNEANHRFMYTARLRGVNPQGLGISKLNTPTDAPTPPPAPTAPASAPLTEVGANAGTTLSILSDNPPATVAEAPPSERQTLARSQARPAATLRRSEFRSQSQPQSQFALGEKQPEVVALGGRANIAQQAPADPRNWHFGKIPAQKPAPVEFFGADANSLERDRSAADLSLSYQTAENGRLDSLAIPGAATPAIADAKHAAPPPDPLFRGFGGGAGGSAGFGGSAGAPAVSEPRYKNADIAAAGQPASDPAPAGQVVGSATETPPSSASAPTEDFARKSISDRASSSQPALLALKQVTEASDPPPAEKAKALPEELLLEQKVPLTPQLARRYGLSAPAPLAADKQLAKKGSESESLERRLSENLDSTRAPAGPPSTNSSRLAGGLTTEFAAGLEKRSAAPTGATAPAATPQPEMETRQNPLSTFSLNVSDVSFKLADAALRQNTLPDLSTLRVEEFINAFDYRDPEPVGSFPIAFLAERARYPFAHDRDVLRLSLKTAATGRTPGRPLNLVLAIDNSGSMERADRVRILYECLRVLTAQLQPNDRLSIVAFARTARLVLDGASSSQSQSAPDLVRDLPPQGGTNLEDALDLAYATARRHFADPGINRVVLLTDGAANLGDFNPDSLRKKIEAQRKRAIALDCFGIGWDGLNDELLESLARNGDGRYGYVNSPEAAASGFARQLAGALQVAASDVKVQVAFNPSRVSAYRQIGYAQHQLRAVDFRNNLVDAAEIGAAEAGNALYIAQILPAGSGPIATVRVRYKKPDSSEYFEHQWEVPYSSSSKPLDTATPSLRLAAAASAFGEKLAQSPYAAEVSWQALLNLLQGVPETFDPDPKPLRLTEMIRSAQQILGR